MNAFFDGMANFFAALTVDTWLMLGILGLLIFTFGLVLGWLIQRRVTHQFREQVGLLRTERDTLQASRARLEEERKTLARELEVVSTEKVVVLDEVQALKRELTTRAQLNETLENRVDELEAANRTLSATVESLNDQVIGLKTQNEQLLVGGQNSENPFGAYAGAGLNGEEPSTEPGGEDGGISFDFPGPSSEETHQPTTDLETRLQYLEDRLASLAEQHAFPPANGQSTVFNGSPTGAAPEVDERGEPLVIRADITEPGVRYGQRGEAEVVVHAIPSLQTPVATLSEPADEHHDDLTAIRQIGPFLQEQLNRVDIYRYEQIASWTEADVLTYTELIGYLPGIIERDDWVGQARKLADEQSTNQAAANTTPAPDVMDHSSQLESPTTVASAPSPSPLNSAPAAAPPEPDPAADANLRIVEGIGPRISALLAARGIDTVGKLANTDTAELQSILDDAGGSFRFHDPKTWAKQAALAAQGRYEELQDWQQELKGGL